MKCIFFQPDKCIDIDDVISAVLTGKIIEQYPNYYPYPSCFVLGTDIKGNFLHVVCGLSPIEIWFITAYHPDPTEWQNDYKTRKEIEQ